MPQPGPGSRKGAWCWSQGTRDREAMRSEGLQGLLFFQYNWVQYSRELWKVWSLQVTGSDSFFQRITWDAVKGRM